MNEHTQNNASASSGPKRRRWVGALVVLVLVVGGGLALSGQFDRPMAQDVQSDPVTAEPRTMQLHSSEVYEVARRDLSDAISFTGSVHPTQRADISTQVGGMAVAVHVQAGDAVAEGEVLVEIDATDLNLQLRQQQATLASTQAQLDAAQQSLDRTQSLAERGLSPQATLDSSVAEVQRLEASLASLQSQVEQVQLNIDRTIIRAPFSGTVSARMVEPGQVVSQGAAVLSLVDLSRLTVDALVPLAQSASIAVGQTASISVQGISGMEFQASVERINPVAEEGTRSITVHLGLDNSDARLRGGMFVTGRVVTEESVDAIALPQEAILGEDEDLHVLVVVDGEIERRDIAVAAEWTRLGVVEIESGLSVGDVIIARPLSGLEAGQTVLVGEL